MTYNLPYRLGVGAMVINSKKEIFVGKRIKPTSDAWQMPQGGVEESEDLEKAGRRELEEETSITNVTLLSRTRGWLSYDFPKEMIPNIMNGRFKGQKQVWLLFEFQGDDSEINIQTNDPEFSTWQWVSKDQLMEMIVDFKKDLYKKILLEFRTFL